MSLLLINAPLTLDPFDSRPRYDRRVPIGILSLEAFLKAKGTEVWFYDAETQETGIPGILAIVKERRPLFVGLNCHSVNRFTVYEIAKSIKVYNPEIKIVVGGVHPTLDPFGTLIECEAIDVVVIGEGEVTLYELIKQPDRFDQIDGIAYKQDGKVKINNPRERIQNLDQIPYPDPQLLSKDIYLSNEDPIYPKIYQRAYLSATRGCPYECVFCSSPTLWTRNLTYRSSNNVIEEISKYKIDIGVENFYFYDDNLPIWPEFNKFCRQVRYYKVHWSCSSRVNLLTHDQLELMSYGGCNEVSFGIESGSPRISDLIHKDITMWLDIEKIGELIQDCTRLGIIPRAHFMLGFPWENRSDIEASVKLALQMREAGMNDVNFFQTKAYPGTGLFRKLHELGYCSKVNIDKGDRFALVWDWFDEENPKVVRKLHRFNDIPLISLNPHLSSLDTRRLVRNAYNLFFCGYSEKDLSEQLWQGVSWHY